jgi:2,3-bisphosphoglycerate-independent phosphoglycerate mutase
MAPGTLLVLDGWGKSESSHGNAIAQASTPHLDRLATAGAMTLLEASGTTVGLPGGVVGNSEIGHLVIGAGRALDYDSLLVAREAAAGRLRRHPMLTELCTRLQRDGRALHLVGLCSDGQIHSHIDHFRELLRAAADVGLQQVWLHAITDGRDVADGTAGMYLNQLAAMAGEAGVGTIATVVGRSYAMDKAGRTDLTEQAYQVLVDGKGARSVSLAEAEAASQHGQDMWFPPTVVEAEDGEPPPPVNDGDALLFVNFRSDRIEQLADMVMDRIGNGGSRGGTRRVELLSMTQYDTAQPLPAIVPRADASGGLADELEAAELRSTRIAEVEKFEHVTFYLNGRDRRPRSNEDWQCIPSVAGSDYVSRPAMNAAGVAEAAIAAGQRTEVALVVANLANIDVVGHSGDLAATVAATEAVDAAVGAICDGARAAGRWVIIVGDHGNGEQMLESDGTGGSRPYGGHTNNRVPCVLLGCGASRPRPVDASIASVAPTVLRLLGRPAGKAMRSDPLL